MLLNFKLIGKRVKESRMRQHISQAELAELIDMSVSYISNIENAKKRASLEALVRISNVLRTTIDELLSGNQIHSTDEYNTDMEVLMSDCSNYEKRIIFELICSAIVILRDNASMIATKDNSIINNKF